MFVLPKKGNAMLTMAPPLNTDDGGVNEDNGAVQHEEDGTVEEARRMLTFSLLLLQEQRAKMGSARFHQYWATEKARSLSSCPRVTT